MNANYIILFSILLLISCGERTTDHTAPSPGDTLNTVTLTPGQYDAAALSIGHVERRSIGTTLHLNGTLDVPPQNLITVAAPLGGFVKTTTLLQGMKVKKGDVLVTLENQEYIQLQQDYLDHKSKLEFQEAEYNRQQELAKENVNAQKSLQQAKANYQSEKASVKGLEAKLAMINIPVSKLESESIKPFIQLYAPITGFVTVVNVNIGQFVNATDVMFKIVNIEHIHAELQVYEKDINKISVGQKVTFKLANESDTRTASVYLIGKEISPERTVRIHCHLDKEDEHLLPGMYVTAEIETTMQEAEVIPSESLVNFEGENFVFASTSGKTAFELIPVKISNSNTVYSEVTFPRTFDKSRGIVTKGAFQLLGALKNAGEE